MYLRHTTSKARLREAQRARDNRTEIRLALARGEVSRRDLFRWGIFTTTGALALKNGLSPFAQSAFAKDTIPTGAPPSPLGTATPFSQEVPRLDLQTPYDLAKVSVGGVDEAAWPAASGEHYNTKAASWHNDFNYWKTANPGAPDSANPFCNDLTGIGPCEGRPWGKWYVHQRWQQDFPRKGYLLSVGSSNGSIKFHPRMEAQRPDAVWAYSRGGLGASTTLPPPLLKVRYGEPVVVRLYNNCPIDVHQNGGFGRNEPSMHNHNAHNGFASDGASNSYFFPGQFHDYIWGTTLARADYVNTGARDRRASGPDNGTGLNLVPGDFRELQSTLWFHDHRFFFTAENVYKGNAGMMNYYSGPDRGHEGLTDNVNLRLPSGTRLPWGNIDFDINLMIGDFALDQQGQLFFDIFDTDGFVGDLVHVNFAYKPFMNVLPRKYRFRLLAASMARFFQLTMITDTGRFVPMYVIANDGNLLTRPVRMSILDQMGPGERFDVIVDFRGLPIGSKIRLVNLLEHKNGRGPEGRVSVSEALRGGLDDPAVGPFMEFRVASEVPSVDVPGQVNRSSDPDLSRIPAVLTEQLPVLTPVRTRHIEFKRGSSAAGEECFPECESRNANIDAFPWQIRVNGESTHFLNANRIALLVPAPGEIEHWVLENGGGGWDHPVHLHFEEGLTLGRDGFTMAPTERLARKDVWRLGEGGSVKIQVQFSEYGGAYVTHCHNTVHEDFAMLMRFQVLKADRGDGDAFVAVTDTPEPRPTGVVFRTPEILPEGDPRART